MAETSAKSSYTFSRQGLSPSLEDGHSRGQETHRMTVNGARDFGEHRAQQLESWWLHLARKGGRKWGVGLEEKGYLEEG